MGSFALLNNPISRRIRARLGRVRRWLRSRPLRTERQRERLLGATDLTADQRSLLRLIDSRISPNDGMYRGDGDHYFRVGLSAIHCIEQALRAAKIDKITDALDLPCGHGRVLRFLLSRFPESRFAACDLDLDGIDFCARVLGAEPAYSQSDLRSLSLGQEFDLIWCGSLITHLDAKKISALLDFFQRHLLPGGLVVFTAAGNRVVEWMASGQFDYGIDRRKIPVITGTYHKSGYGYTDYSYMPDYGVSLTSPGWIRAEVQRIRGFREVYFESHAWDNHQDVYGFVKEADSPTNSSLSTAADTHVDSTN